MAVPLTKAKIQELRSTAQQLTITVTLGKAGISDAVIQELKTQLGSNHLVKVKLLRSALEGASRTVLADELAAKSNSTVIEVRGNTVILYS